jgi:acyl carrier protein
MSREERKMTREDITDIVFAAMRNSNRARPADAQLDVSTDALLFASGSPLDSLGLVTLLMDVEDLVAERGGRLITLSDERAMSRKQSPFRDVPSLVDHIEEILAQRSSNS